MIQLIAQLQHILRPTVDFLCYSFILKCDTTPYRDDNKLAFLPEQRLW